MLEATSWTIGEGQRWAVLGPNGSGKSTILRIASTYEWPTTGTVEVLGERLGRTVVADLRRRIGYTASALERLVDHRMDVRTAVASGARAMLVDPRSNHGAPEPDWAAVDAAVARVGLTAAAGRPLHVLSEGERRRVQIARALVAAPELLLLDEPTAGLDIGGREQLVGTLTALASDPTVRAVALVTHHVEEIPPGFTHVALVVDRTIAAAGPVEEVLTAANLSAAFGLGLRLHREGDRWAAHPTA
ncbi:MAG TPA: ATP-binding cassette domain-containing protein [Euzebya sp.]|nr:ATP-binding cassette domain-containing protein [Euzebya sp.]